MGVEDIEAEHGTHVGADFAPGSRLRERELSQALDVSRVPFREALQQLETEGFTHTSPRRGATVKQTTLRDVKELFDVRLSLEVVGARLAAQTAARGESSSRLQQMMGKAEEVTLHHDHAQMPLKNTALHAKSFRWGGNSLLEYSMKPLLGRTQRLFTLTGHRNPQVQCAEHLSLCQPSVTAKRT